jgi:hypothetical protein
LHHGPIRMYVKEGSDVSKSTRVDISNWWGIGAPKMTFEIVKQWNI